MIISISNPIEQTLVVSVGLLIALLFTMRRFKKKDFFPIEISNELKGLAVLMIVLSHIGYFLVNDHRFLAPLSNYAGVGVDLFLILSGYGLTMSALRRPLSVGDFYKRRLSRVYVPMVTVLVLLLVLDGLFLQIFYPIKLTLLNLVGIYPEANLYINIDSPLWYMTFLLMIYIIFPILFRKRTPLLSAVVTGLVVWGIVLLLPFQNLLPLDRISFYKLHFMSFPMGMALAVLINKSSKNLTNFFSGPNRKLSIVVRTIVVAVALGILAENFYHSHVGEIWYKEELTSMLSAFALMALFVLKPIYFNFLELVGVYSFEIYLLHWPMVWRYNFLYGRIPAGYATLSYIVLFLLAGWIFKKLVNTITKFVDDVIFKKITNKVST